MTFFNKINNFIKNKKGIVGVELAILFIPFLIALLGSMQLALIFLANQSLDEAIDVQSRRLLTGQIQKSGVDINTLKSNICQDVAFVSDCNNSLQLSIRSFSTYSDINNERSSLYTNEGRPIIIDSTFQTGVAKDILVVSSQIDYPIILNSFFPNNNFTISLASSTAFRTENYR